MLQVSDVTATSAQLSWSYTGPEDIQYYVIQYKPKHANQKYSEISGVITSYYTVRSLSPYTEYEMSVIAVNNIGRGPPSQSVVVTTGETGNDIFSLSLSLFLILSIYLSISFSLRSCNFFFGNFEIFHKTNIFSIF